MVRGTRNATTTLLVGLLLLTGCETQTPSLDPRISDLAVNDAIQGVPPEIGVTLILPGVSNKRVRSVTAEFRSTLDPGRPFVFADGDFAGSNTIWTGHLPALNVGPYEAKVNVTLRTGPNPDGSIEPPIDEVISSGVVSFNVTTDSEECFNFAANADDVQDWTHSGYFLVENDQPTSGCSVELVWFNDMLNTLFGANCLPEPQFRFDMVSPDVSSRQGWAQSQGVVLVAGWNVPEMLMQPILGRANGLNALIPKDDDGQPVFYPMTASAGSLQKFRIPMIVDQGTINSFRVRFFGAPMSTGNEAFARISSACPIPGRPG